MSLLSIIIIAKNEAHDIADCVASARFADEVLVLDSGSSDATVAIATANGARVVQLDWPGYGQQKNRALDLASGDWLFFLDADERITPQLQHELKSTLLRTDIAGACVPRRSQFCGQFMQHSDWWPDYTPRLVRKGCGRYSEPAVHERLEINGDVATLTAHLLHYSYRDLEDVLGKLNSYSSAGALVASKRGKRGSLRAALGHGVWAFIRTYVLKRGFLDGRLGLVLAIYNAQTSYYKYLKLMLMQANATPAANVER